MEDSKDRELEPVLDDCMLVFEDHIYLVDGVPRRSPISSTVRGLKRKLAATKIQKCNIAGRGLTTQSIPYWPV